MPLWLFLLPGFFDCRRPIPILLRPAGFWPDAPISNIQRPASNAEFDVSNYSRIVMVSPGSSGTTWPLSNSFGLTLACSPCRVMMISFGLWRLV